VDAEENGGVMSNELLFALVSIVLVVIIVFSSGYGLELVRKEKLVRDGSVLLAITGIVICGIYYLHHG
jgi:hypothetical protein